MALIVITTTKEAVPNDNLQPTPSVVLSSTHWVAFNPLCVASELSNITRPGIRSTTSHI